MPAMLLGEMLLQAGALTKAQLEQVLNAQSIYGGRLGTNLVEMGLIGEEELARVLNEKLGVPCIDPSALNNIPHELLNVIPRDIIQRYRVLPVALEGKRLTLAMADPSDFKAVDEIGFATGLVIVPKVCSELRLNLALERYYGIKRTLRYIPVEGGARSRFAGNVAGEGGAGESALPPVQGRCREANEEPCIPPMESCAVDGCQRQVKMEVLAERLATAPAEAQVVSALMWYLGGEFDRASFLRLRSGAALGIQAIEAGSEVETFPGHVVPLDQAPQLNWAVQEKHPFLGEFGEEGPPGQLLKAMGGVPPAPASVVPVAVGGQVAAVVCVNDQKGRLSGGLFELQRVVAMAELAFEMLRIRKRIKAC